MRGRTRRVPRLASRKGVFTVEYLLVAVAILGALVLFIQGGFTGQMQTMTGNAETSVTNAVAETANITTEAR